MATRTPSPGKRRSDVSVQRMQDRATARSQWCRRSKTISRANSFWKDAP
jgi:hypothetical protein